MKDKLRPDATVYGPYLRKDGRKHVVLYWSSTDRRQTISYPKWLMEQHIGRELGPDETVDHKDRDFTNDNIDNLQILDKATHASSDSTRVERIEIQCVYCGELTSKKPNYLDANSRQGKAGPFCGKRCSGKYGSDIREGRVTALPSQPRVPRNTRQYYKSSK